MCFPSKPSDGGARAAEEQRQSSIRSGTATINQNFSQFDDPYFAGQSQKYTDYYKPQLTEQYDKARRDLILSLTRTGGINSSAGAQRLADLDLENNRQIGAMTDSAAQFGTQARTDVERNRSELIGQLNASADPASAAASSLSRAQILSAQPAFSPLGDLFTKFAQQAGTAAVAEQRGYPGWNTGAFNSKGSSKVVN